MNQTMMTRRNTSYTQCLSPTRKYQKRSIPAGLRSTANSINHCRKGETTTSTRNLQRHMHTIRQQLRTNDTYRARNLPRRHKTHKIATIQTKPRGEGEAKRIYRQHVRKRNNTTFVQPMIGTSGNGQKNRNHGPAFLCGLPPIE